MLVYYGIDPKTGARYEIVQNNDEYVLKLDGAPLIVSGSLHWIMKDRPHVHWVKI